MHVFSSHTSQRPRTYIMFMHGGASLTCIANLCTVRCPCTILLLLYGSPVVPCYRLQRRRGMRKPLSASAKPMLKTWLLLPLASRLVPLDALTAGHEVCTCCGYGYTHMHKIWAASAGPAWTKQTTPSERRRISLLAVEPVQ